ncbi:MAG: hypothetical protein QM627_02830 [Luteolibacter sp.]
MSEEWRIDLGMPAVLVFRGPDAVRFLNGQITQDVRRVVGSGLMLPACVTDAKGKLQFRVWLTESEGGLWIIGGADSAEALEARITRYLIADDVEVENLTGHYALVHFTGMSGGGIPAGVIARASERFGEPGADWLVPAGEEVILPAVPRLEGEALEHFRISRGIPQWGVDLLEGQLPPEAGLDATDISYQKGCYIGQEVISRIKSAGKVNRSLTRLWVPETVTTPCELFITDGRSAGTLTSVSPVVTEGKRAALGYIKRTAEEEPQWFADLDQRLVVKRRG